MGRAVCQGDEEMKIFWLLFLLTGYEPNMPQGVYTEQALCIKEGQELQAVIKRKFVCEPATEIALRYYTGETLGNTEWSSKIKQK